MGLPRDAVKSLARRGSRGRFVRNDLSVFDPALGQRQREQVTFRGPFQVYDSEALGDMV